MNEKNAQIQPHANTTSQIPNTIGTNRINATPKLVYFLKLKFATVRVKKKDYI